MEPSSQTATNTLPASADSFAPSRRTEDLAYQVVTVAAILLVLGTLWLF